jgi:hypothetical protein
MGVGPERRAVPIVNRGSVQRSRSPSNGVSTVPIGISRSPFRSGGASSRCSGSPPAALTALSRLRPALTGEGFPGYTEPRPA